MMFRFSVTGCVLAALTIAAMATGASARPLPPDAGVINVKDHGAVGDGKADDTEAVRAAVRQALDRQGRYATPPFVYFPAGTYRVTGPIESKVSDHGWSGGWRAGLILWGDGPGRTTIRLADNAEGYGDPENPRYVIATGSESDKRTKPTDPPLAGNGNRAFRHGVYHLTVDVGRGNPGAVGIDFIAHNRGAITHVVVRSSDPDGAGRVGINMTRAWPGPALVKHVTVEGFDYGIRTGHAQYSMTFEHINLRNQRVAGVEDLYAQALFFRNLDSENSVPAFILANERSQLVLLDSRLTGGSADETAVRNPGSILYLRNVTVDGYGNAVENLPDAPPAGTTIEELVRPPVMRHTAGSNMPPLVIEDSPEFWSSDPNDFANVVDFGAKAGGEHDSADGIQAAIDSGKPIVYLPNGSYSVSRPIVVRGGVRLITGMQSAIRSLEGQEVEPIVRFEATKHPVIVEHMWLSGRVEHASPNAVTLRHLDMTQGYRNTPEGTGDVFVEDTIGKPLVVAHPQRFFGRQVNCEFGDDPLIENHGGDLWIMGYKTEGQMPVLKNVGGRVEILGGLFYPLRPVPDDRPMIINEGGSVRLSYVMNGNDNYRVQLRSQDGQGTPRDFTRQDLKVRGPGLLIDVAGDE